ncbi:MAG: c-type cytochrome [Terriglobales bacterium]
MTKFVKTVTAGALALGLAMPCLTYAADTGPELFKSKCAMCHGPNGEGKGKIPALGSANVQKMSDADLKKTIENGTKTANGMMPKYGDKLSSTQIDDLVKYVRSLKK